MKALAFFCLGIALLAMPSGLRAMDPLTELDMLILDAQRKLYQVDAHEKPGRQTPDSRETRSAPAPGSQSQPVPFFGEPPALSSQPVPRQARLGKPAGNVKEYGPAFARFTIEVPRGWTAHALENGVKVEKKDQRSILQIELMPREAFPPETSSATSNGRPASLPSARMATGFAGACSKATCLPLPSGSAKSGAAVLPSSRQALTQRA